MKVAIDIGPLKSGDSVRGVGFYTKRLITSLEALENKNKDFHLSRLSTDEIKDNSHKFDVVHIPYFNPFFLTVPKGLKTKVVIGIHDVTPLVYPKSYPSGFRGMMRLIEQKKRLRQVDAVITLSESSKKDIVRFLDVHADKIHTIYLAPDDKFHKLMKDSRILVQTRRKYNLPQQFVLYTGDVNYNKNISTLIKACGRINANLVIVGKQAKDLKDGFTTDLRDINGPKDWLRYMTGKPHPEQAHYTNLSSLLKRKYVYCTGFVSDDELNAIYNLASVYCQPSYMEGFGLPAVEAIVCGTPVVISRTQALVEIAEDFASIFEATSFVDLADKLARELRNPRRISDDQINIIKKKYNWENTALETFKVYESI